MLHKCILYVIFNFLWYIVYIKKAMISLKAILSVKANLIVTILLSLLFYYLREKKAFDIY